MGNTINTLIFVAAVGVGGYFLYSYFKKIKPVSGGVPPVFLGGTVQSPSTNSLFNDISNVLGTNVNSNVTQPEFNAVMNKMPQVGFDQIINDALMQSDFSASINSSPVGNNSLLSNTMFGTQFNSPT